MAEQDKTKSKGEKGAKGTRGATSSGASTGAGRASYGGRGGCPFSAPDAPTIDYKDIRLLQRFLSEQGKIMPTTMTNVSRKNQRILVKAIKRARFLALLPYVVE
ncbi:MAG: 30S ribosomal protein S18 [Alphaproteobacteria bacterium GM202ARS2]|nr:30S ribosomal protein S18 [Alphaproteobacteria bacterium GM202ARS2]